MIEIRNKANCCGCEACVQVCPRQCISFNEDAEGFRYPHVDSQHCMQCGLCEQVCPMLHPVENPVTPHPFSYQSSCEEVLMHSSSGGLFSALAERFVAENAVVVGARFNEKWEVEHACAATMDEVQPLCTSKYVQSRLGQTYQQVATYLKEGRRVLFCGTPCQVSALRRYIHKNGHLLTCIDFVCHGVPSPMVWRRWLSLQASGKAVKSVNFRSKVKGWHNYSLRIELSDGQVLSFTIPEASYTRAFSANITLRPSCYRCPMRSQYRSSDLTMADFWGAEQLLESIDDKGLSLVFANTDLGLELLNQIGAVPLNLPIEQLVSQNRSYCQQTPTTALRGVFFSQLSARPDTFSSLLDSLTHLSPMSRRYFKIRTFINQLLGKI